MTVEYKKAFKVDRELIDAIHELLINYGASSSEFIAEKLDLTRHQVRYAIKKMIKVYYSPIKIAFNFDNMRSNLYYIAKEAPHSKYLLELVESRKIHNETIEREEKNKIELQSQLRTCRNKIREARYTLQQIQKTIEELQ